MTHPVRTPHSPASTEPTAPVRARDLTGDEQDLFDRLAREARWRLTPYGEAPVRTRTVANPHTDGWSAGRADRVVLIALGGVIAAATLSLASLAWQRDQYAFATLLTLGVLASVGVLGANVAQEYRRALASGTGARLAVPARVAAAHADLTATVEAVAQIALPGAVHTYLHQARAHRDRLLVQAARLHRQGLSDQPVGQSVRDAMIDLAAETSALVDVLLGNPDSRTEAIAWRETSATLAQSPTDLVRQWAKAVAFDMHQARIETPPDAPDRGGEDG